MEQNKKQEVHTHKIGIYLWIWGLLFVFSFFSYMVDYLNFQGLLRWTLIVFFQFPLFALPKIEKCKNKYPNQIDKVPIQS